MKTTAAPSALTPITASRTFNAPAMAREYGARSATFTVTAKADRHFSVTAELTTTDRRYRDPTLAGGCMHDDAARFWPAITPIIALHLSDVSTGEPMHAEKNGWYWLAGALPFTAGCGLSEKYHGGSGSDARTPDQCLAILAAHLRLSSVSVKSLAALCREASAPREVFAAYVDCQRARWKAEAEAGIALIRSLATVTVTA